MLETTKHQIAKPTSPTSLSLRCRLGYAGLLAAMSLVAASPLLPWATARFGAHTVARLGAPVPLGVVLPFVAVAVVVLALRSVTLPLAVLVAGGGGALVVLAAYQLPGTATANGAWQAQLSLGAYLAGFGSWLALASILEIRRGSTRHATRVSAQ